MVAPSIRSLRGDRSDVELQKSNLPDKNIPTHFTLRRSVIIVDQFVKYKRKNVKQFRTKAPHTTLVEQIDL